MAAIMSLIIAVAGPSSRADPGSCRHVASRHRRSGRPCWSSSRRGLRRMLAAAFRRWGVTGHFAEMGSRRSRRAGNTAGARPGPGRSAVAANGRAEHDRGLANVRPELRCWFVGGSGGGLHPVGTARLRGGGAVAQAVRFADVAGTGRPARRPDAAADAGRGAAGESQSSRAGRGRPSSIVRHLIG